MLFERGRRDVLAWAHHIGLTAEHVQHLRALTGASASAEAPAAGAVSGGGAGVGTGDLQWLQQGVDELPLLLDVPPDLMHFLGDTQHTEHGRDAGRNSTKKGCMCLRFK